MCLLAIFCSCEAVLPNRASASRFIHMDYRHISPEAANTALEACKPAEELEAGSFDVLVSMYAGFVSEFCTWCLKVGGVLLVSPSHGDAALAALDPRYTLSGVVIESLITPDLNTHASSSHEGPHANASDKTANPRRKRVRSTGQAGASASANETSRVAACPCAYRVDTSDLSSYMIPKKKSQEVTVEAMHASGKGIVYTRSPFAYLFTRIA